MKNGRPISTRDLLPSEKRLLEAMQQIGFGRFECLRIEDGQTVLDPWPTTVRSVRLGAEEPATEPHGPNFDLKKQVADFFACVRCIQAGGIRRLDIRYGLPVSMELEETPHASERPKDG